MKQSYHFIGAGGIGMSALAQLLLHDGATVSGSDKADSAMLRRLEQMGAHVSLGHRRENLPPATVVVQSDAVKPDNPELVAARADGRAIMRRSDLLAQLMTGRDGIAVSGTHGKTSTTAMVARILLENGLDPSVVVGGEALDLGGNAHAGTSPLFVAEACEAYSSFLGLSPRITVVTNIEPDHMDHHGNFDHIKTAFQDLARHIQPGGLLIVNADNAEAAALGASHAGRTMTYGLLEGRLRAVSIHCEGLMSSFLVTDAETGMEQPATIHVPGRLNISNALAAFAVALEVGLEPAAIARGLATYTGVRRRFEEIGEAHGARVFDDYAHHPTEIVATIDAARAAFPRARVIAVFQPHLYSRTRDFMDEFIAAFDAADMVVLSEIYAAREEPITGVSSELMARGIRERLPETEVYYVPDRRGIPDFLAARVGRGDIVLTLGAGDIRAVAEAMVSSARVGVAA